MHLVRHSQHKREINLSKMLLHHCNLDNRSLEVITTTSLRYSFDYHLNEANLVAMDSNKSDTYSRALKIFTASVIKPDHDLRRLASDYHCYEELMEIRFHCLTYLQSLKEIHEIDFPDESDELETEKIRHEKAAAMTSQ